MGGSRAAGLRQLFYGPVGGVIVVLAIKGVPFAYLGGPEGAARTRRRIRVTPPACTGAAARRRSDRAALLAPASWSAFAIVFAESVGDFGVASTLANDSHFTVATFTLYNAMQRSR